MTGDNTVYPKGDDIASSIAEWLTARRAQFADRAVRHGIPLSIAVPTPVAEFTPSGMQSTIEMRQQSLFAAMGSVVHPSAGAALTKPFIDSAGEKLAESLVEAFDDRLKYLCNVGPVVVQQDLEHPELITRLTPPQIEPGDITATMLGWDLIFYALMILRQCLLEYLSSLSSLDADDAALARHLAEEAVGFAHDEEVTYLGRVPLAGLEINDSVVEVEDCSLRRLSRDELGYLFQRRHSFAYQPTRVASRLPGTISAETWLQERVALEVRARHPKTSLFFTVASRCQKVLLAFHLLGIQFAGAGFGTMLREPAWVWSSGQGFQPLLMPRGPSHPLAVLAEEELQAALALADLIPGWRTQRTGLSNGTFCSQVRAGNGP